MSGQPSRNSHYQIFTDEPKKPPDYGRVMAGLSDRELTEELAAGLGDPGYRDALRAEADRRGI